ncbi:hypothetical protein K435DRAFT_782257 [Dendrothele bispora CBS 962.96]|uniref:TFIIS central domain-containing protein n=1 Tax=Dendrothele bispora (strain CBS 962.96) TaxID=1314807 RepID=A0A4S8LG78_DENBC|nr:hypothetical protein K435DRAFT_782257 [Dendrothele bispora CBS 962.96]
MTWEGADAIEEVAVESSGPSSSSSKSSSKPPANKKTKTLEIPTPAEAKEEPAEHTIITPEHEPEPEPASESDPTSEDDDDYVAEEIRNTARGKRRPRRPSYVSESDNDSEVSDRAGRHRLKAGSPASKRKASQNEDGPPAKKPKNSSPVSNDPSDDPTRKYCLGKLEEVFRGIYLRYPHVHSPEDSTPTEKKPEELSEEEKNVVLEDAKRFTNELEQCVFEIYSEPDKSGKSSAGPKYKDRFRTLQFNLSKPDRIVIHKRIASAQITPKEISVMSSTDLANEELKQSIKIAEQEALEHSILQKSSAPRAKITHKGLEDIEDVTGQSSTRERERQQQEEEDRMERERQARIRTSQPRQRTASLSVPPESPVVPQSPWGAPPAVPLHAFSPSEQLGSPLTPLQRPPLFLNTSSEMILLEPELNLADLINIEDETSPADAPTTSPPPLSPKSTEVLKETPHPESVLEPPPSSLSEAEPALSGDFDPVPTTPTPLSANESSKASSFDLNSLWSLPKSTPAAADTSSSADVTSQSLLSPDKGSTDVAMESLEEANDRDFDMFLEEKDSTSPEALQASFRNLPQVWSGKINMPLDSTVPQETPVVARQMGGRTIESTSSLWKTLFPSDHMRIDGRVPVENSAKFLLQMRMNPTKELVAVAFSPAIPGDDSSFKVLSEFLIAKNRHGLVFPWGQRPKEYHPGREFYIIPLLSSSPLPDYMELLDELRLPKVRVSNYLVGIWILNKGKLASPPPLPPPPIIPTPPVSTTPPVPSMNAAQTPALPASLANLAATLPVDQNALAQEIASLTPEQMALISRALASVPGAAIPVPAPAPVQSPSIPPANPGLQAPIQMPIQTWGGSPGPNYSQDYPYPHHEHDANRYPPHDHHGERGHWDRGRRGRGRGRGHSGDFHKPPSDSGWPRKRNSGPEGPSSPLRRWS